MASERHKKQLFVVDKRIYAKTGSLRPYDGANTQQIEHIDRLAANLLAHPTTAATATAILKETVGGQKSRCAFVGAQS